MVTFGGYSYIAETSNASEKWGRTIRGFNASQLVTVAGTPSDGVGVATTGKDPTFTTPLFVMANGNNPLVSSLILFGAGSTTWSLDLMGDSDAVFAPQVLFGVVLKDNLYTAATNNNHTITTFALAGGPETWFAGAANAANAPSMDGSFATAVLNISNFNPLVTDGTNLYAVDGKRIRMIDVAHQTIGTIAGRRRRHRRARRRGHDGALLRTGVPDLRRGQPLPQRRNDSRGLAPARQDRSRLHEGDDARRQLTTCRATSTAWAAPPRSRRC